jgi:hypothetical protein
VPWDTEPADMGRRLAPERAELEAVMRRVYSLSRADQRRLFATLSAYLGEGAAKDSKVEKQITRRADALDAIRAVAEHLGRGEGETLTGAEFNEGAKAIGLKWSSQQIIRAWQSWRQAIHAYRGEWVRETPGQRALRRATSGRRRGYEDRIASLRDWLATQPASTTRHDYDRWRADTNLQRIARDEPPHLGSQGILASSPLKWDALATRQ